MSPFEIRKTSERNPKAKERGERAKNPIKNDFLLGIFRA